MMRKLSAMPVPPAVYYFGNDRALMRRLEREIPSHDLVVNDAVMQIFNRSVPGEDFFSLFSRMKKVMVRPAFFDGPWRRLPLGGIWARLFERRVTWSI